MKTDIQSVLEGKERGGGRTKEEPEPMKTRVVGLCSTFTIVYRSTTPRISLFCTSGDFHIHTATSNGAKSRRYPSLAYVFTSIRC